MVNKNTGRHQTAFTVSIDAAPDFGVTTGISAQDRSRTIELAINPTTDPNDLRRPGHIFPIRAQTGGVLKRAGHTEAAVDLARLAGLYPAGVICPIQNPNGSMARLPELTIYARKHSLPLISIKDLIQYRLKSDHFIQREAIAHLPTKFGNFELYAYRNILDGSEATAIVKGKPQKFALTPTLVRIHSQCFTGDVLGSLHCDCHQRLHTALKLIETIGQGVVVYLKQDRKDISLADQTYLLHDQDLAAKGRLSQRSSKTKLEFETDCYSYSTQILKDLGLQDIRLLTDNPREIVGLQDWGLNVIEIVPLQQEVY